MAIINSTPDSFYTSWDGCDMDGVLRRVQEVIDQGADILDIGAYSTRPGHSFVSIEEEWERLYPVLQSIRSHFPKAIISIDTFRAEIAKKAIALGADMINDVTGGNADKCMWEVIKDHHLPYTLTHATDIHSDNNQCEHTISQIVDFFQSHLDKLHSMGISDVIIDPGFGFAKTEEQNYCILQGLDILSHFQVPILVGLSRKSMLYKPLHMTPTEVLPATIAANTIALERGAHILRVHDVVAAKQAIDIYLLTHKNK